MATNKQRDAERQRLQRQLEERRQREAARKRFTLIASIVGTLVVIAAVVITVVSISGGDDKQAAAESTGACADAAKAKGAVTFQNVTVGNAATFGKEPKVCSSGTADPAKLQYKDLIVGKGKTPALTSTVSVQYTGQLYKKGTQFDSSWARGGMPAEFSLQGVVPGFTQGIGGNTAAKIPAMKVGGRRIVILPSALGYGAQGTNGIPANSSLVFVIDLVSVK